MGFPGGLENGSAVRHGCRVTLLFLKIPIFAAGNRVKKEAVTPHIEKL
jgi:hypothetical protein